MNTPFQDIRLSSFPEKIFVKDTACGKVQTYLYGQKSYDNQLAVITHYLHNPKLAKGFSLIDARKYLKEYLEYKFPFTDIPNKVLEDPLQAGLFSDFFRIPFPDPINYKFTFVDLFAGMGGFRLAMQAQGGKCVFSSEWNTFAQKTYLANFGEMPFGDITKEATKKYIPERFDVLCAGFPCQPFSIAGVSGIKTTCKDRWRQVLTEADRIDEKYLFTLQQGISRNQLQEMKDSKLTLVVPHKYISSFPKEFQSEIKDLAGFIQLVKEKQETTPKHYLFS